MTKKNQSEEEKKREEKRKVQLGILKSKSVKNLFLAAIGRNTEAFGKSGKETTQDLYVQTLLNPDNNASQLMAQPYLRAVQEAQQSGRDIYEHGSFTPIQLLEDATAFYQSAINGVKVSDVLSLMGINEVNGKNISSEQKEMYMEDFKKANEELYKGLANTYFSSVASIGIGEAQIQSGKSMRKNLESILKEDPDKRNEQDRR